jgi:hypothetical protein
LPLREPDRRYPIKIGRREIVTDIMRLVILIAFPIRVLWLPSHMG